MTAHHDHDGEEAAPEGIEDNPIWQQDNVTLHSVGIDIGSAGTQVALSRLDLRRIGEELTSRYVVIERRTTYQSPVHLTPYLDERTIDAEAVGRIVDEAYAAARQRPEDVDTGIVILTGEALRRRNARTIAEVLSARAGELVTASAGHHMEAMLAAYGSGAARTSHDAGTRILNVDIGGGTTKLALIEGGRVNTTAAVHVGGRLQVVDDEHRITRLEPAGRLHARRAGFDWSLGEVVADADLERVAEGMADALLTAAFQRPVPPALRDLYLTEVPDDLGALDGVVFSGGVAEYIYGREERDFNDLGRRLGRAIRARVDAGALPAPLLPPGQCIRATVLGAAQDSVQLSGNTCAVGDAATLLPRRNLRVVRPVLELGAEVDPEAVGAAIAAHLRAFEVTADADVALALAWQGQPRYQRILGLAHGVVAGLSDRLARGLPLFLLLDADIAQTLGRILRDDLGVAVDLLVLDGVLLRDFDFIDLGVQRLPSGTVPVTIKSLLFDEAAGAVPTGVG